MLKCPFSNKLVLVTRCYKNGCFWDWDLDTTAPPHDDPYSLFLSPVVQFHELFFCPCVLQYSRMHKLDPVENQIQCLKNDIKQLQADGVKPPPQSLAEAAVHTENFITSVHTQHFYVHTTFQSPNVNHICVFLFRALVNAFKLNQSAGILKVGIAAFYQIVSFVCEDTQRHPPTRQFFTSCIEILGQVISICRMYLWLSVSNTKTSTKCLTVGLHPGRPVRM